MKFATFLILFAILTPRHIITTIAGGNGTLYMTSGASQSFIPIKEPNQITVDKMGNIYIADAGNHVIRKISTDGTSSVVAGNFNQGFQGDGGIAVAASLNAPCDVAIDNSGNLYIADMWNCRIRKINPLGVIYTIAGTGQPYSTGDYDLATRCTLNYPIAIAIDNNNNLLVVERIGNCVRKISPSGIITTIAGNGEHGYSGDGGLATAAMLNAPTDITVDANNNIYIADGLNNRIRKVSPSGYISTIAGTGERGYDKDGSVATQCRIFSPYGVFVDSKNNIYYSDNGNTIVRKIDNNNIVTTIAGTPASPGYSGDGGTATKGKINNPGGLAIDHQGNLLLADYGNNAVRKITNVSN